MVNSKQKEFFLIDLIFIIEALCSLVIIIVLWAHAFIWRDKQKACAPALSNKRAKF